MQEEKRYAVGVDIGSFSVKVVVALLEEGKAPTIVAAVERPARGMRKGGIIDLVAVAESIDKALVEAQQMAGTHIQTASVNLNGSHIVGLKASGVVSVTGPEVTVGDLKRVEETVRIVNLPPNRTILDILPQNYILDQNINIKNPTGMSGVRLELNAYVTTALTPHLDTLHKTLELAYLRPNNIEISGLAAAQAALTTQEKERGVVLVDIGASTTNVVVYEEGDLVQTIVIPLGGDNITNDIATVMTLDWDVAEQVKLRHACAVAGLRHDNEPINVLLDEENLVLDPRKLDMVVEARVEALFAAVNDELSKIGCVAKLPGGVVLTGGTANLMGLAENARATMRLHARVIKPPKFAGVTDKVLNTKFITAVGLMLVDAENRPNLVRKKPSKLRRIFGKK